MLGCMLYLLSFNGINTKRVEASKTNKNTRQNGGLAVDTRPGPLAIHGTGRAGSDSGHYASKESGQTGSKKETKSGADDVSDIEKIIVQILTTHKPGERDAKKAASEEKTPKQIEETYIKLKAEYESITKEVAQKYVDIVKRFDSKLNKEIHQSKKYKLLDLIAYAEFKELTKYVKENQAAKKLLTLNVYTGADTIAERLAYQKEILKEIIADHTVEFKEIKAQEQSKPQKSLKNIKALNALKTPKTDGAKNLRFAERTEAKSKRFFDESPTVIIDAHGQIGQATESVTLHSDTTSLTFLTPLGTALAVGKVYRGLEMLNLWVAKMKGDKAETKRQIQNIFRQGLGSPVQHYSGKETVYEHEVTRADPYQNGSENVMSRYSYIEESRRYMLDKLASQYPPQTPVDAYDVGKLLAQTWQVCEFSPVCRDYLYVISQWIATVAQENIGVYETKSGNGVNEVRYIKGVLSGQRDANWKVERKLTDSSDIIDLQPDGVVVVEGGSNVKPSDWTTIRQMQALLFSAFPNLPGANMFWFACRVFPGDTVTTIGTTIRAAKKS